MKPLAMLDAAAVGAARLLHRLGALILLPLLAAVVAGDVFARYFAKAPIEGAQDISTLSLLMLFMAGLPACTAARQHVRVETLHERMSPRWQSICTAFADAAGLLVVMTLAWWQLKEVAGMARRGEQADMLPIPLWPVAAFVGLCAVAAALVLLAGIARAFRPMPSSSEGPT